MRTEKEQRFKLTPAALLESVAALRGVAVGDESNILLRCHSEHSPLAFGSGSSKKKVEMVRWRVRERPSREWPVQSRPPSRLSRLSTRRPQTQQPEHFFLGQFISCAVL